MAIKLHLGCGAVYRPGWVNIDGFDDSVADRVGDAADLPFESESVDGIEAEQLIEHFDFVQCKYVLAEWFRVLQAGGGLVIETPDLEQAFRKFSSEDLEGKGTALQWIFGIGAEGMGHRTGFTFDLLKTVLEETGFEGIVREKQKTHLYEPGMRVVCRKPESGFEDNQLFACFRQRLRKALGANGEGGFVLPPLEKWLGAVAVEWERSGKNDAVGAVDSIIAKAAACNPLIALAFVETCVAAGVVKKQDAAGRIALLKYLDKNEFHKKILSLWMKSKKGAAGAGGLEKEFGDFIERIENLVLEILRGLDLSGKEGNRWGGMGNYRERLKYITGLQPADIGLLDFTMAMLEAKKEFNKGVKAFSAGMLPKAEGFFSASAQINPCNPLAYWNLARLGIASGATEAKIAANYGEALKRMGIIGNKDGGKWVEKELKMLNNGKRDIIPKGPVSEDFERVV